MPALRSHAHRNSERRLTRRPDTHIGVRPLGKRLLDPLLVIDSTAWTSAKTLLIRGALVLPKKPA